jgi:GT2 family glycosyltransferase
MNKHIFVLSYCGAQEFFDTIDIKKFPDSTFYFVDNGNQNYTPSFDCSTYTTSINLGCAGGWNLLCSIAFDYLKLEKIIITQDDANYTNDQVEDALLETTENCLTGVYQPHFEFSCFAIHADTYKRVGQFDENFIYVYSEDADYKQRCMLNGVVMNSLMYNSAQNNKSLTLKKEPALNRIHYNREYLHFKWGNSVHPSPYARADSQAPFEYRTPFKHSGIFNDGFIPITNRIKNAYPELYKNSEESRLPSAIEFDKFIEQELSIIC